MKDFKNFFESYWMGQPENRGSSFTYASCMLDYGRIPDEIYDSIIDVIEQDSGARREWIEQKSDMTLLSMIDICDLNELLIPYFEEEDE